MWFHRSSTSISRPDDSNSWQEIPDGTRRENRPHTGTIVVSISTTFYIDDGAKRSRSGRGKPSGVG